jgi:hypothetical protein
MTRDDQRSVEAKRRRERLATALRENLKRRKAQSRGRAAAGEPAPAEAPPDGAGEGPQS